MIFESTKRNAAAPGSTGLQMVMSPYDEQCFEAAMRIRDDIGSEVRVSALCLGGNDDDIKLFKRAFSWGVEEGDYLCRPGFQGRGWMHHRPLFGCRDKQAGRR